MKHPILQKIAGKHVIKVRPVRPQGVNIPGELYRIIDEYVEKWGFREGVSESPLEYLWK